MEKPKPRPFIALLGALAAVAGAILVVPIAHAALQTGYGESTAPLPNDSLSHATTASCPTGMEVVGGGIRLGDDLNDFVQGTYPEGETGWTVVGYRRSTAPAPASLTASAICLDGAKVSTKSQSKPLPGPSSLEIVTSKCPRGTSVGGGGALLGDDLNDYMSGSFPASKRVWTAVGHGSDTLSSIARCVKGVKLKIRSKTIEMPGDDLTHTVTAKCPKRMRATGGGGRLENPLLNFFQGSYPTGKARWTAAGYDTGELTAYVICRKR